MGNEYLYGGHISQHQFETQAHLTGTQPMQHDAASQYARERSVDVHLSIAAASAAVAAASAAGGSTVSGPLSPMDNPCSPNQQPAPDFGKTQPLGRMAGTSNVTSQSCCIAAYPAALPPGATSDPDNRHNRHSGMQQGVDRQTCRQQFDGSYVNSHQGIANARVGYGSGPAAIQQIHGDDPLLQLVVSAGAIGDPKAQAVYGSGQAALQQIHGYDARLQSLGGAGAIGSSGRVSPQQSAVCPWPQASQTTDRDSQFNTSRGRTRHRVTWKGIADDPAD
jgi:hypothetical protein